MSIGLEFIRACIERHARTELRSLAADLFDEHERPTYDFVIRHVNQYQSLPDTDTCSRNGFPLTARPTEPPEYYANRLRTRAAHNLSHPVLVSMSQAMQGRRMSDVLTGAQNIVRQIAPLVSSQQGDVQSLAALSEGVMAQYRQAHLNPGRQGITLGWNFLDDLTNGAEGGDVVTVVARPNKGKSWIISKMAHAAWNSGANVLLVTMEMTGIQFARRVMGLDAGINPNYIREGRLSQFAYGSVQQTITNIRSGAPFNVIQGSFNKSLDAVDAAMEEFAPDIVLIDASYLMAPSKRGTGGNRKQHEVLAAVGTEIKEMAMGRNRPFVQSVQFNREAERAEERTLAHIGGTDVVGQISTIVMGLDDGPMPNAHQSRRCSVLKNRENPLGEFVINFLFDPPNFNYRPPETVDPEDNNGVEAEWSI